MGPPPSGGAPMTAAVRALTRSDGLVEAARAVLAGGGWRWPSVLSFAGPAVIASVAYMDPGNFATNIQAGAEHGYMLLWVVVLANVVAMLFQGLSAKLGIVTGRNLAELARTHFPRPVVLGMWLVSEIAAMATDLAEFLGAAIGLALLFRLPLLAGMVVTGVITYALLGLQKHGFRPLELVIGGLVGVIGAAYLIELVIAPPDWRQVAVHSVVPQLGGGDALLLAVGIVGATVMPHAIFLHSALTQDRIVPRNETERRKLIRFSHREVAVALGFAGLVNLAMVAMAAAVFHDGTHDGIAEIGTAYHTLVPLLGGGAAAAFLAALIASGLSSSTVGTLAGQVVMQGFVGFRIPVGWRRLATMVPSFAVVAVGVDATRGLVLSQVVLSFALPVPMVALLLLMRRRDVMGAYANTRAVTALATTCATAILALNLVLVLDSFGVAVV